MAPDYFHNVASSPTSYIHASASIDLFPKLLLSYIKCILTPNCYFNNGNNVMIPTFLLINNYLLVH